MEEEYPAEVLPTFANVLMATAWVLLLGGRWVVGPFAVSAGWLSSDQLSQLDAGILLRIYLLLFTVTALVVALRVVRSLRPDTGRPEGRPSAHTVSGEDETADERAVIPGDQVP